MKLLLKNIILFINIFLINIQNDKKKYDKYIKDCKQLKMYKIVKL